MPARSECAIVISVLAILLFSATTAALQESSMLISNTGTITLPPRIEYVLINATATYELNFAFQVITHDSNSLAVLNHAILDVSLLKGSLFVYNGTYDVYGTINMQSNVNMTLQDGVFINETKNSAGVVSTIIDFPNSVENAAIYADSNATIHGFGGSGSFENAINFYNNKNITIAANHPNGLKIYNIGYTWLSNHQPGWVNDSLFQNIWAYQWQQGYNYMWHGAVLDGVQNCRFINITDDGANGDSRCPLCIGGESEPSNNITISGGIYENGEYDNGIYLGGWNYPVTNVLIVNVTTANNNAVIKGGHSGLKFRPASNVTVIGWVSNGDYNGIELSSTFGVPANFGGSMYNNISGTINDPVTCGLVLSMDYADNNYKVAYNWFNITVNNATQPAIWVDDGFGNTTSISQNTIYLAATGCQRQAIDFANMAGNVSYNTIYGTFIQNGKSGYPDISFENIATQNYNVVNVYSTTGNPNGLYTGILGTNVVNYPYTG